MNYPGTPAAVAAEVLKQIRSNYELFDMSTWAELGDGQVVRPNDCGTVMCAAGWTVHVTGWNVFGEVGEDGYRVLAEKDGEILPVHVAARRELGLSPLQTFWYDSERVAIQRLKEIAKGSS